MQFLKILNGSRNFGVGDTVTGPGNTGVCPGVPGTGRGVPDPRVSRATQNLQKLHSQNLYFVKFSMAFCTLPLTPPETWLLNLPLDRATTPPHHHHE